MRLQFIGTTYLQDFGVLTHFVRAVRAVGHVFFWKEHLEILLQSRNISSCREFIWQQNFNIGDLIVYCIHNWNYLVTALIK